MYVKGKCLDGLLDITQFNLIQRSTGKDGFGKDGFDKAIRAKGQKLFKEVFSFHFPRIFSSKV